MADMGGAAGIDEGAPGAVTAAEGKRHFVALDAMRGIAALLVGCLHASQILLGHKDFGHAYLAVDFFFCLSGFVVAYAYEERLRSDMGVGDFLVRRIIRLWPLIVIGSALGTLVFLGGEPKQLSFLARGAALGALTACLLPAGLLFGLQAYPVNNPIWSLFFEVVANGVYAGLARRAGATLFKVLLVPAFAALVWAAVAFGGVHHIGSDDWRSFLAGFARVALPFLIGVVIYQMRLYRTRRRINAALPMLLLIAMMVIPGGGGGGGGMNGWLYDLICIAVVFPLVVVLGANADGAASPRLFVLLGELSYPFYLIHQPILRAVKHLALLPVLRALPPIAFAAIAIAIAAAVALIVSRLIDVPVRRRLTAIAKARGAFSRNATNARRAAGA